MGPESAYDVLFRKLRMHSIINTEDEDRVRQTPHRLRHLQPGEEICQQGDAAEVSVVVMTGMVGRYHTLEGGRRQYLSVHLPGDWPDAQTLYLRRMDHSICTLGPASVATFKHEHLHEQLKRGPSFAQAIWRETLVDAALLREAITNNSARRGYARLAHFFSETFYRARRVRLVKDNEMSLPLTQAQVGETWACRSSWSIATCGACASAVR
jgi:CRP-like cAMP-binding protein